MSLEIFMNDRYRILKLLYSNQITIKDETYISLSQQEIADIAHFSKQKTNKILNELIENKYLTSTVRGKYIITENGFKVIESISNTNI